MWSLLRQWIGRSAPPVSLVRGRLGERAARKHLQRQGLKFLTANYRPLKGRGEIDLVFRDGDCLVFVEVKTRSSENWFRPAAAVDRSKKELLARAGLDYLRRLRRPEVKVRFDIVEVLLGKRGVEQIRHLPDAFPLPRPLRYG